MREEILALRAQGKTYNEIVEIVGCSKSTVNYHCGEEQADKRAKRQRDRRSKIAKYLQELKEITPCTDCGINYPYYVMDFDHMPGSIKDFNIGQFAKNVTLETLKEEIIKCELVCANCHRFRSWSRLVKNGDSVL